MPLDNVPLWIQCHESTWTAPSNLGFAECFLTKCFSDSLKVYICHEVQIFPKLTFWFKGCRMSFGNMSLWFFLWIFLTKWSSFYSALLHYLFEVQILCGYHTVFEVSPNWPTGLRFAKCLFLIVLKSRQSYSPTLGLQNVFRQYCVVVLLSSTCHAAREFRQSTLRSQICLLSLCCVLPLLNFVVYLESHKIGLQVLN